MANLRAAKLFRFSCCLIAGMLCLVPALHVARMHLCCPQSAGACCAATPALAESATVLAPRQSIAAGNVPAWSAASSEWPNAVPPVELRQPLVVSPTASPGAPGWAPILRI